MWGGALIWGGEGGEAASCGYAGLPHSFRQMGGLHLNLAKTVAWGHKCRFICGTHSWQKVWASSTPG